MKDISEDPTNVIGHNGRLTGKIMYLNPRGWGFISSESLKFTRIFFHWTFLKPDTLSFPDLKKGMKVEFSPMQYPDGRGWHGYRVEILNK